MKKAKKFNFTFIKEIGLVNKGKKKKKKKKIIKKKKKKKKKITSVTGNLLYVTHFLATFRLTYDFSNL